MEDIDQDVAKVLFEEGGCLLCLDVPERTEFGIDLNSWAVGPKFKGVKMIPPGLHFMFYSAVSKEGDTAPRTGFFCYVKRKEIIVKKWDCQTEQIVDGDCSEENIQRIRTGKQDLDRYLGAYPYESHKKWVSLTSHITKDIMERIKPTNGQISSVSQIPLNEDYNKREDMEVDEKTLNISFEQLPEHRIKFTEIPKKKYPDGSGPADITKHSLDSSYMLECMMQNMNEEMEILGELQLAFVCFLVGQVYDAFEHWKCLVHVLCTCDDALSKYPKLFDALIGVLHFQLLEAPKDFFVDIVTKNNFLTVTLQVFFSNLESSTTIDKNLIAKAQRFRSYLTKRFKWDFESEPEDYEPAVVEM